jgi:hypothetical protein
MYEAGAAMVGVNLNEDESDNEEKDTYSLLVSNSAGKKPLLSINIFENDDLVEPIAGVNGGGKAKHRGKRRTHSHNHPQSKSSNTVSNYRVNGIDKDTYSPKLCYNNYPDANRECCLITYFVNFNALKWSSWILSPTGFVANYCSGKCNDAKSKFIFHA